MPSKLGSILASKVPTWAVFSPLLLVIVAGGVIAGLRFSYTYRLRVLESENAAVELRSLQSDRQTLNLAIEFGFDPIIVKITQQLAKDTFKRRHCDKCQTWRWVDSDRKLAYLILSLVQTESGGNPKAYNATGASGLTQLMFSTAQLYDKTVTKDTLFDIPKNLQISMNHFVDLLVKYRGNDTLAILAWNRGSGAVDRAIAFGNSPDNGYALAVFTHASLRNAERNADGF